jgi:hypothetical protein
MTFDCKTVGPNSGNQVVLNWEILQLYGSASLAPQQNNVKPRIRKQCPHSNTTILLSEP